MGRLISIGLAGLAGTLLRYWLSGWIARRFGETFPTGTLLVNVAGCFAAGFISYLLFERFLVSETTRTVLLIGLPEWFRDLGAYRMVVFGLAMVLIMVFRPRGLIAHREPSVRLHPVRAGP